MSAREKTCKAMEEGSGVWAREGYCQPHAVPAAGAKTILIVPVGKEFVLLRSEKLKYLLRMVLMIFLSQMKLLFSIR